MNLHSSYVGCYIAIFYRIAKFEITQNHYYSAGREYARMVIGLFVGHKTLAVFVCFI